MAASNRNQRRNRNGKHRKSQSNGQADMAKGRGFWSGTISFGLVSIPVDLFPATRSSTVHFRMLGPEGTPVRRRYYCPEHNEDVEADEIVRGYEVAPGEYVVVSDEELEALEPQKTRDIDLRLFVNAAEIPPTYFERAYYLAPSGNSNKAYRLLADVMQRTGKAGIATFVMRNKEYLVAILAENGILRAETLRFHDELRTAEDLGLPAKPRVKAERLARFEQIIRKHSADRLDPHEMLDDTSRQLLDIVHHKYEQQQDLVHLEPAEDDEEEAATVNLLEVIRRSLQSGTAASGSGASDTSAGSSTGRRKPTRNQGKASATPRGRSGTGPLPRQTKDQLYERAKKLDIPGRSGMSKDELIEAIRRHA